MHKILGTIFTLGLVSVYGCGGKNGSFVMSVEKPSRPVDKPAEPKKEDASMSQAAESTAHIATTPKGIESSVQTKKNDDTAIDADIKTTNQKSIESSVNTSSTNTDLTKVQPAVLRSIDPDCSLADLSVKSVYPPKMNPIPKSVPENCRTGFELNNLKSSTFVLNSLNAVGIQNDIEIEIDIATYKAPDIIEISAVGTIATTGKAKPIFNTCRMQTAEYGDPTAGLVRPPEDSIRYFRAVISKGTQSLKFDFSKVTTPTYIKVIGLCEFNLTKPESANSSWRIGK